TEPVSGPSAGGYLNSMSGTCRHRKYSTRNSANLESMADRFCVIFTRPLLRFALFVVFLALVSRTSCFAQDWVRTGTGLGVEKIRIAVPDFKTSAQELRN